jgi:hypothetical protein
LLTSAAAADDAGVDRARADTPSQPVSSERVAETWPAGPRSFTVLQPTWITLSVEEIHELLHDPHADHG